MIYYHNPKCSKSREGLSLVKKSKKNIRIKFYLSEDITHVELNNVIKKLEIKPIELVRKKEKILKEKKIVLDKMSDNDIIEILLKYPILIERPILISDTNAVVGRPPENLKVML